MKSTIALAIVCLLLGCNWVEVPQNQYPAGRKKGITFDSEKCVEVHRRNLLWKRADTVLGIRKPCEIIVSKIPYGQVVDQRLSRNPAPAMDTAYWWLVSVPEAKR